MNIQELEKVSAVILSEEELIYVLGGENFINQGGPDDLAETNSAKCGNCDKCGKCDKCGVCV